MGYSWWMEHSWNIHGIFVGFHGWFSSKPRMILGVSWLIQQLCFKGTCFFTNFPSSHSGMMSWCRNPHKIRSLHRFHVETDGAFSGFSRLVRCFGKQERDTFAICLSMFVDGRKAWVVISVFPFVRQTLIFEHYGIIMSLIVIISHWYFSLLGSHWSYWYLNIDHDPLGVASIVWQVEVDCREKRSL